LSRKSQELFGYLQEESLETPVFGNVYLLSSATPAAPDLLEFVDAFARQDGSAASCQRVVRTMVQFYRANRKAPAMHINP
jgi:hypothetical protein